MSLSAMTEMSEAIRTAIKERADTLVELSDDDLRDVTDIVGAFFFDMRAEMGRRNLTHHSVDGQAAEARALRALQRFDQLSGHDTKTLMARTHLIEAETLLGVCIGVGCSGVPDSWRLDGTVGGYDHAGGTCPVHEWLFPEDHQRLKGTPE